MSNTPPSEYASKISGLIQERLRIKAGSLARQIHKSGRRMPKRIKRAAMRVDQAQGLMGNPKLERQIDVASLRKDAQVVIDHLEAIDPFEVLKDKVLLALAKIATLLIVIFVVAVWYARSRGMV